VGGNATNLLASAVEEVELHGGVGVWDVDLLDAEVDPRGHDVILWKGILVKHLDERRLADTRIAWARPSNKRRVPLKRGVRARVRTDDCDFAAEHQLTGTEVVTMHTEGKAKGGGYRRSVSRFHGSEP
jgi:hypothetical protein